MQNNKKICIFSDSRFLIYIEKSLMPNTRLSDTLVETIYIEM